MYNAVMCGAYLQFNDAQYLAKRFNAEIPEEDLPERYNIRPGQEVLAILNTEPDKIQKVWWGIKPTWDKAGKMFLINTRADSLEKPTRKKMIKEQRCLILADGFYEWKKVEGQKGKVPYLFKLKDSESFAFAGVWHYETIGGKEVPHCSIITTEPNDLIIDVHNRMPAILLKEDEHEWLNPDNDEVEQLIHSYQASEMEAYPISTLVNNPKNDHADILIPTENSK